VIFQSLTLDGVGPYGDRQSIDFAHDERRPVTLVGGLNGAGKTTLIRSLFQVLYGPRSLSELGSHRSYSAFLNESIHRGRDEAALELSLTIPGLRDDAPLAVRRSWRRGGRGGVEELDVFVDGNYDEELSESWDETIEQIAPLGVARLFFFDGEKIEALADLESAAGSLKTAVGSLLGLDLVEQLRTDLVAVQRRVLRGSETIASEILEERQSELSAAERLAVEAKEELAQLEGELELARVEAEKLQSAARSAGGDLVAQREELEARGTEARNIEATFWEELRGGAPAPAGPRPPVPGLLAGIAETSERSERGRDSRRILDLLEERDRWLLEHAERLEMDNSEKLTMLLESDRRERSEAEDSGEAAPYEPSVRAAEIMTIRDEKLTDWRVRALQILDALDEAISKRDELDRQISKIPSDDSVYALLAARESGRERVEDLNERVEEQRQLVAAAEAQASRARDRRDAELTRLAEAEDGVERQQRVTQHAERAKATLAQLADRVAERHVGRIADYTMQCLERLLRKERLIDEVRIDPATFAVALRGGQGEELLPSTLSAGERQLTALSLLWSLARAAGRPLPVVIDTPLGRLDAGHRRHVVERYIPAASHQVVVLSTDTEIEGELYEALKPSVGLEHQLLTDSEGRTTILDGYLEVAAA
jgi:DNA sulfur modification protein DndD